MEVTVAGPCFRCKKDAIRLDGIVLFPPAGFTCSYQWYRTTNATTGGTIIPGATGTTLQTDPCSKGPFPFEVVCNDGTTTSVKEAIYTLKQCGENACTISVNDVPVLDAMVYPNPASNQVTLELEAPTAFNVLALFNMTGQQVRSFAANATRVTHSLDLTGLPAGSYVLRGQSVSGELVVTRIVKQ